MSAAAAARVPETSSSRWVSPLAGRWFDTEPRVRPEEAEAIAALGVRNLRRLQHHDPAAPGWRAISRLTAPAEAVNASLDSPPTPHRRRAMLDVVALLLTLCADTGRTFWAWTPAEWIELLGRSQSDFRRDAPTWVGDEVRPYLAAHAYLLGGFRDFNALANFQRLTLSWRIFGKEQVDAEIARVRTVLASWGYKLGEDRDTLLPAVISQVFLHVGSPHLDDLSTEVFDEIRSVKLLPGARANTLFAVQRATATLGYCDPPTHRTGGHSIRASGGAELWEQWADRWHATSTLTPRVRGSIRADLLKVGRWVADQHPEAAEPAAWTRTTCAAWIAALDRMNVGDYVQRTVGLRDALGKPLQAPTKAGRISALRRFFLDVQERSGCRAASIRTGRWPPRAASPHCWVRTRA